MIPFMWNMPTTHDSSYTHHKVRCQTQHMGSPYKHGNSSPPAESSIKEYCNDKNVGIILNSGFLAAENNNNSHTATRCPSLFWKDVLSTYSMTSQYVFFKLRAQKLTVTSHDVCKGVLRSVHNDPLRQFENACTNGWGMPCIFYTN